MTKIHAQGVNKYAIFALLAIPLILTFAFFGKTIVKKVSAGWEKLTGTEVSVEAAP